MIEDMEKSIREMRRRGVVAFRRIAENCRVVRGSREAEGELALEQLPKDR